MYLKIFAVNKKIIKTNIPIVFFLFCLKEHICSYYDTMKIAFLINRKCIHTSIHE